MWKEIPPFSFSAGERKIMAHFVVSNPPSDLKLPLFAHHGIVDRHGDVVRDPFESKDTVDRATVGAVADAEMHCAVVLLPLAHRVVVFLAEIVKADRNFAADKPGVFVAVGCHEPAHLVGFCLALNINAATVL